MPVALSGRGSQAGIAWPFTTGTRWCLVFLPIATAPLPIARPSSVPSAISFRMRFAPAASPNSIAPESM